METRTTAQLLKSLNETASPYLKASFVKDGAFRCCLVACFSKAISVATKLNGADEANRYFGLASLRSICEELIVFSFTGKLSKSDRDTLMQSIAMHSVDERLGKQSQFFKHVNRNQQLLNPEAMASLRPKIAADLESIHKNHGWQVKKYAVLPSTSFMSKKTGLEWLYDYVFAGTSSLVHFDPGQLMRMGWGPSEEEEMRFDVDNFNIYHQRFGEFFSLLLLVGISKRLAFSKEFQADIKPIVSEIEEGLMNYVRWPELVTFEEMNVKPPSEIFQVLFHVMSKDNQSSTLFEWDLIS